MLNFFIRVEAVFYNQPKSATMKYARFDPRIRFLTPIQKYGENTIMCKVESPLLSRFEFTRRDIWVQAL